MLDVERIKQAVDLVALAGQEVRLHKVAHNEWAGPCPKCGGVDRLHVKRDFFFCRQCYSYDNGQPHDAIAWLMWLHGLDFKAACARLTGNQAPANRPTSRQWSDPAWQEEARRFVQEAQARLEAPEGQPARDYLTGRGILPATWRAWGLGFAMPRHPRIGEPRPAICLPWLYGGQVSAVQYRFFGPGIEKRDRFAQRSGGERMAYGADLIGKHWDTLILVEGELNALSLWQAIHGMGLPWLDVVSFGSQGRELSELVQAIARRYRQVIFWCDDPARVKAALGALPGARGLCSPQENGEKLDANALLRRGMLSGFLSATLGNLLLDGDWRTDPAGWRYRWASLAEGAGWPCTLGSWRQWAEVELAPDDYMEVSK